MRNDPGSIVYNVFSTMQRSHSPMDWIRFLGDRHKLAFKVGHDAQDHAAENMSYSGIDPHLGIARAISLR